MTVFDIYKKYFGLAMKGLAVQTPPLTEDDDPTVKNHVWFGFSLDKITRWFGKKNNKLRNAGPILWKGDLKKETALERGRYTLTFWGSKRRYFREDGFSYGSDIKHNEIYFEGKCMAIAPGPVLGAALKKITTIDNQVTTTQWYVYAVIYKDDSDILLRKKTVLGGKFVSQISDEQRIGMMRMQSTDNPDGWETLATQPKLSGTHYPPTTPWFFNKSCTEAVCMRTWNKTFNNGRESVIEPVMDRYTLTIGTSPSFSVTPPEAAYIYTETANKWRDENFTTPADQYGLTHEWRWDIFEREIKFEGVQTIFADYVGDELYLGKVEYNSRRIQKKTFALGIDPDPYLDGNSVNRTNLDQERPNPPVGYIPVFPDQYNMKWVGTADAVNLKWGKASDLLANYNSVVMHGTEDGTSTEYNIGVRVPDDPYLYYNRTYRNNPLFLYLDPLLVIYHNRDTDGLHQNSNPNLFRQYRKGKLKAGYQGGIATIRDERDDSLFSLYDIDIPKTYVLSIWATEAFDHSFTVTNYTGLWPTFNDGGAEYVPPAKDFYVLDSAGFAEPWPTIEEVLYSKWTTFDGHLAVDEFGYYGFYADVPKYFGEEGQTYKLDVIGPSQQGKLSDLVGSTDITGIYPI